MATAPPSTWLARLLFTLTLAAAALLILVVFLAPLVDNNPAVPADWRPVVRLFARDGTVRRTAVASSLGLLVTACLFFRPTDGGVRKVKRNPRLPPPPDIAGA
jgi:hypothetical protein